MSRDYGEKAANREFMADWKWKQTFHTYEAPLTDDGLELATLRRELNLEIAKSGFDAAGIADPTGVCDAASMTISLHQGKYGDAGLSACSIVPYIGDGIAKPFKAFRSSQRIQELIAKIMELWNKIKLKPKNPAECPKSRKKVRVTNDKNVAKDNLEYKESKKFPKEGRADYEANWNKASGQRNETLENLNKVRNAHANGRATDAQLARAIAEDDVAIKRLDALEALGENRF